MIQAFKILKGIDRIDPEIFFTFSTYNGTRGHRMKLSKQNVNKKLRANSFIMRIVNYWNSFTDTAVNAVTINAF